MRVTQRGWILLGALAIVLLLWLNDVTTPDLCKVPLQQMPTWCQELIYP